MSGLLLCGKRSINPYLIKESGINVYSLEEFCYYIYNNTYMLGRDFFSNELVEYFKTELELPSFAQKLRYGMDHNVDMVDMFSDILSASNYYLEDERENILRTLTALGSKSKSERMKARADMLLERRKYISAVNAYKEALNQKEEVYSDEFIATIWNNMGVTYTKQFLFEDACKCFRIAYDIKNMEECFDNMVSSAIFSANDNLIEDIAIQYQISEETLEQYFKAIESNKRFLVKTKEINELKDRLKFDSSKEYLEYKKDVHKIFALWKEEYRQENM